MTYIYGLADPRTSKIRYIGRSVGVNRRLGEHINEVLRTTKGRWIEELRAEGIPPTIFILEEVENDGDALAREAWWIEFGRSRGWPLTNSGKRNQLNSDLLHIRSFQLVMLNFAYALLRDAIWHDAANLQGKVTQSKAIIEMNLFELAELFCDWVSVSRSNGGIQKILDENRVELGEQLYQVLSNTIKKLEIKEES